MGPRSYGGRPQQSITVGVKSTQEHCRERLQQVFATQNWIRGTAILDSDHHRELEGRRRPPWTVPVGLVSATCSTAFRLPSSSWRTTEEVHLVPGAIGPKSNGAATGVLRRSRHVLPTRNQTPGRGRMLRLFTPSLILVVALAGVGGASEGQVLDDKPGM